MKGSRIGFITHRYIRLLQLSNKYMKNCIDIRRSSETWLWLISTFFITIQILFWVLNHLCLHQNYFCCIINRNIVVIAPKKLHYRPFSMSYYINILLSKYVRPLQTGQGFTNKPLISQVTCRKTTGVKIPRDIRHDL